MTDSEDLLKRLIGKRIVKTEDKTMGFTLFFTDKTKLEAEIRLNVGEKNIQPFMRVKLIVPKQKY